MTLHHGVSKYYYHIYYYYDIYYYYYLPALCKGIYNYIPETNLVSTVYSVAAVLYLQVNVYSAVMNIPRNTILRQDCNAKQNVGSYIMTNYKILF